MGPRKSAQRPAGAGAKPPLLPAPKHITRRSGEFRLGADTPILLPTGDGPLDRRLLVAAEQARDSIRAKTGISLPIERPRSPDPSQPAIACRLDRRAAITPRAETARDAYYLSVRRTRIEISAPGTNGIRHGLQTLCQLASRRGRVAASDVRDQPDFRDRGIMLDVSRGKVPTRATLEALVELCSRLRLNVLMLYVEHTFDFRAHPEIGRSASPLDAETILSLDAYAADRGVELVPCLQSLGHMEHVLSLERYASLAESDRLWWLSPSHPGTEKLLRELYDEFLPLFGSSRFNANCDEPFDLGRGLSAKRQPRKKPGTLFADHVGRLEELTQRHDKQLMIWADFAHQHPDQLARLGKGVVLLDWWYEAEFDENRIARLRREGFEVWACPGTSSWNALFPRIANAQQNVNRWADAGRRHGAKGLLDTDWGDFGHYNALGASFHGYAWSAQQAWSGRVTPGDFDRAFSGWVFGEESAAIGRLYRRLGAVEDAGFQIANGSPLQYLYFDALGPSFFLQHAKRRALERSARRLEPVLREVERLALAKADDDFVGLARQEIAWAARATQLSIEKSLAAIEYNEWRANPSDRDSAMRRRLARALDALADRQAGQLRELETLWLARSEISDFAKTRGRARRSIAGLRGGAKRARENRPPRRLPSKELTLMATFNEMRRQFGMAPR